MARAGEAPVDAPGNKYRWCVCDLDGTLLDGNGEVSPRDQAALTRAAAGVELILATGRSDLMVGQYVRDLGVRMPIIACNGGLIRDARSREILHVKPIAPELAERLCHEFSARRHDFLVYTIDEVLFSPGSQRVARFETYNTLVEPDLRVPLVPLSGLTRDGSTPPILKFLVADMDEPMRQVFERRFNGGGELTIVSSERGVVDIMAPSTTKGGALEMLASARGVDLARTIAFGDNYNDVSMLERCGFPIAMANAEAAVKHVAAYVTLSNEESGVGDALERLILTNGAGGSA